MAPHTGFIVAAFLVTVLVLGGTAAAVLVDHRVQRRALARLAALNPGRPARDATGQDETP